MFHSSHRFFRTTGLVKNQNISRAIASSFFFSFSQAERENDSLIQAQGKKEEDALSAAVGSFQTEFQTDLKAVKAGGGPYQVRST